MVFPKKTWRHFWGKHHDRPIDSKMVLCSIIPNTNRWRFPWFFLISFPTPIDGDSHGFFLISFPTPIDGDSHGFFLISFPTPIDGDSHGFFLISFPTPIDGDSHGFFLISFPTPIDGDSHGFFLISFPTPIDGKIVSFLVSDPHDFHQDLSPIAAIFPKKNLLGHALVATMLLPATMQLLQRSSHSPKNCWWNNYHCLVIYY